MRTQVPFTGQSTIKESARLHCPVCGALVHYVLAQVGGPGAYQPCGHAPKGRRRLKDGK